MSLPPTSAQIALSNVRSDGTRTLKGEPCGGGKRLKIFWNVRYGRCGQPTLHLRVRALFFAPSIEIKYLTF